MTKPHPTQDGFVSLWPTTVLQRQLPGYEAANRVLCNLIEKLEDSNRDLTTDYASDNLLAGDNPTILWLRECINKTVADYFRHFGADYPVDWSLHGWANINRFGDYHDLHNHPHSYLSGTYYVSVPEHMEELETRADVRPGRITFYDPRGAVNMTAIRNDPNIEAEYTVNPVPGMIMLWPAFLHHFVHPNLSKQHRISISYNVMLKWSDDYLPQQI
ncbi:MAG: 2OG-Fe(II) oxygenase family protein [Gammaproteobacteria bacterium]|nr:2OG-Fe(II) oxygenase family protein [Gammaproteobacteria bacterium]MDH3466635.1 2OG-Fe(II) oxygenase family protein [Gammaproteobacteria bacterium]